LKFIVGLLAALLVAGTTVVLAAGATKGSPAKRPAAVTKAAAPKTMHVACARNGGGKLQYLPDGTQSCKGKVIQFPKDAPVTACQLDKGNSNIYEAHAKLAPPAHKHSVAGMLFVVSSPSKCKAPKYPDSHARTLPPTKKNLKLCAGKRRGTVRVVDKFSKCNDLEFDVVLKKLEKSVNHKPTANDQTVSVDEDGSKPITLTGSDPDGDSLTFTIASGPSHGSLTGSGAHRVYHPDANFTGTDSFTFKVADGHGGSDTGKVTIHVVAANDAPAVTTSSGSTAYTENAAGTEVDGALTVSDGDDSNLEGATVAVTTGFQPNSDQLEFTDQSGITGSYNAATGQLQLTGSASVSDYQAALRSVKFSSTNDTPSASKTVTFKVNDGDDDSNVASKAIAVTAVNDAPTVSTSSGALTYAEGDGAKAVDGAAQVDDVDSSNLSGAVVKIASGFVQSEDSLSFTNTASITGSYDSSTGVLTLTGTATPADYQAALRSVTYTNSSANPSTATRTVSFKVTDDLGADSNTPTKNIDVSAANTKPAVTTSGGSASNTEGSQSTIDGALTVGDPDDTHLESAQVRISSGFQSGDELDFVDELGITGTYNSGVLTLTGHATLSDYQQALRDVKFKTTNDNPSSPKTIEFKVNDGDLDSDAATKSVTVTGVNDAPTMLTSIGSASYTEGGTAPQVDPSATPADADSANLSGATVSITSNFSSADGDSLNFTNTASITGSYNSGTGVLTLSGSDTVANYQAALRSITFSNTSDNPTTATRTVSFQVTDDGALPSNTATRNVTVAASNDAPVVTTSGGPTAYTEGDPATTLDGSLTVSDADSTNLTGATVSVTGSFESGDVLECGSCPAGITPSYNSGTGVLDLSGSDTVANYQSALRSITYRHTGDNPGASKTVSFQVKDSSNALSNTATKGISITRVNDAPTLTTTAANLSYTEGDGQKAVDPGIDVADPDSTQIQGATVQITGNFVEADDELTFTDTANISGQYNDLTGTLSLTGTDTLAAYQTALRSVKFENVNPNPSGSKTVSFQATDAEGGASNVATRTIDLTNANTAPTVTTSSGSLSYTEGDPATTVDGSLTVTDPDSANIASAKVRIATGFESGDTLACGSCPAGITPTYNSSTGVLDLAGTDTVANYQTALQSVTYLHTGDNPGGSKSVGFVVTDSGSAASSEALKGIDITGVNDAPTINTTATNLSYTEGDGAVAADGGVTVTDPDSTQIQGATVQITGNFVQADDELSFTSTVNIAGAYNDTTGTLTLSGNDTVANYQAALRSVKYENVSQNPSGSKTVSFQATDSSAAPSNTATRTIDLTNVNDAPVVTTSSGPTAYTEGQAIPPPVDSSVTVTDADNTSLTEAHVRISSGFQTGDVLACGSCPAGITPSYNSSTGVLDLSGTDTVANYQAALQSITYSTTNPNPSSPKTVEFKVKDAALDSNAATKNIAITGVNTAPTISTTAAALTYTEGDGPKVADSGVTASDPDSTNLSGATISISGNFVSADDELAFTDTATITGAYNDTTGVLTLSGTDTVANYNAALQSVTYENVSQNPSGTKTLSFQVTDDGALPSNTATRTVNLTAVNDAPVITPTNGSTPYTEGDLATTVDSGVTVTDADDTNVASGKVRISSGFQIGDVLQCGACPAGITPSYNASNGELTLAGTDTVANYQTALQSIQFVTTNPAPVTSKTIEFKVTDPHATDSNTPTKEISITPVNSPPTVTSGGTLSYTENDAATFVHSTLTVTEPEGDSLTGASASITGNFQSGEDALSWTDNNLADNITKDLINSTSQTIVLLGVDTAANYQAALRNVKYANSSENPSNLTRTVTFAATDTFAATGSDTRSITVTPVDDPPDAVNDTVANGTAITEDANATAIPVLANDTDVDGGLKEITAIGAASNGATVTGTGGSANHWTGLTYKPAANYCNSPDATPSATPETFSYTVNGGDTATVSVTVICVNDPPVVTGETLNGTSSMVGNTKFIGNDPSDGAPSATDPHKTVTADILSNDTDVDGPGPLVIQDTDGTNDSVDHRSSNLGGSVSIESDGDFVYSAPTTTNGANPTATNCDDATDSFQYTVSDQNPGTPGTASGTVTLTRSNCVWYVNNSDGGGNNGTSDKPFDTLGQADTATPAGDAIFVFKGDGTTTGYDAGVDLAASQKLIGEAATLTVGTDTLHTGDATKRPLLTDTANDVVVLDDANEVRGLDIDPQGTGNSGIAGGTGDASGTIDDVNITDTGTLATGPGLELDSTSGTWNISKLAVSNGDGSAATSTDSGIRLNNAGTVNFLSSGTNSVTTSSAKALDLTGTNMGAGSEFDSVTSSGSGSGGVLMSGTSGTTTIGDGTGTDLSLTTTSGSIAALNLANPGTVSVPGSTASVSASGGPALDVTNAPNVSLPLGTVQSQNSSNDGINWDTNGASTFTAQSGGANGIKTYAGIAVDVNGGSGTFTYPGILDDGTGATADITGRSGGTVTLSGNIADGADAGGGITLASNTGGTTTFSGTSKVLSTGASDAVTSSGSAHTINFTNGGLNITTTSGKGFEATGGGTVNVQTGGSDNVISTTTGRALNIASTTIGANDVTFKSISSGTGASGPANGIRLDTTGTTGDLVVTGGAGLTADGSGGTIQTTSSNGVDLRNSHSASLDQVNITNAGDSGVYNDGGPAQLSLMNITGAGDAPASAGNPEAGITELVNIGSSSISGSTITGSFGNGLDWKPPSGTGNLAVTSSKFNTEGNAGVQVSPTSTSTANIDFSMTGGEVKFTPAEGMLANAGGSSTVHADIDGVDMTNTAANPTNFGVEFNANNTGHLLGRLNNSTIKFAGSSAASAVTTTAIDTSNVELTITNNTIGTPGTNPADIDSGTIGNHGISELFDENSTGKVDIEGNTISHTDLRGIHLLVQDFTPVAGNANLQATVRGNVVNTPDADDSGVTHLNGMLFEDHDASTFCLDLANNKSSHIGAAGSDTDFRLRAFETAIFNLEGYVGGDSDANVESFVIAQNAGAPGVPGQTADANDVSGTSTWGNSGGCTMPTLP
jgi:hypothetical protein